MSRVIKFRAWDGHHMTDRIALDENGKPFQFLATIPARTEDRDWPIMQFTGLSDKNGRDVYEGDILQDVETPEWKYEVIWGKYGWEMKALWHGWHVPMFRHGSDGSYEYEVVSNIYENEG